jgi:hypothetical protein
MQPSVLPSPKAPIAGLRSEAVTSCVSLSSSSLPSLLLSMPHLTVVRLDIVEQRQAARLSGKEICRNIYGEFVAYSVKFAGLFCAFPSVEAGQFVPWRGADRLLSAQMSGGNSCGRNGSLSSSGRGTLPHQADLRIKVPIVQTGHRNQACGVDHVCARRHNVGPDYGNQCRPWHARYLPHPPSGQGRRG